MKKTSSRNILASLDKSANSDDFPILDHPAEHLVSVRLTAFSNTHLWAVIIEKISASRDPAGHFGIQNVFYSYGNCLNPIAHKRIIFPTSDGPEGATFFDNADEEGDPLRPTAKTIKVRGLLLHIPPNRSLFLRHGIVLRSRRAIWKDELLRLLNESSDGVFFADDSQILEQIDATVPMTARLRSWHHPDIANGEKPSSSKSFRQLVNAMVKGEPYVHPASEIANTHWTNWQDDMGV